jgi:poly-gamma-glutamate synthesis protein (capsule biosynthesis protein)
MMPNTIIHRESDDRSVRLRAVGDVYFGGDIAKRLSERRGFNPLPDLNGILGKAQLAYFNLECAMTTDPNRAPKMTAPSGCLDIMRSAFDIAGVANNHTMDAGAAAFVDMLEQLKARRFVVVGGGRNREEAESLQIVSENGIRLGFIACADYVYTPNGEGNQANERRAGVSIYEPRRLLGRIGRYREQVDVLVCAIHTGLEFTNYPDPRLMRDARAMVDMGANVILIDHAHVRQGIEMYRDGLIAYGLGNFVFDINQPYMREAHAAIDIGLIVDIFIDKRGVTGYEYWLAKIHPDGTTAILSDDDRSCDLYQEQRKLNESLGNPALIKREWKKVCRKYLKDRLSFLYWTLRSRSYSRFIRAMLDLKRRENRRWISGLFEI